MSITVGEVRVSPDLRIATAFVLPLGGEGAEEALAALNRSKGELRHHVAKAMTLKFAPELRFVLDETFDRMDATRRLLADERVQRDIAKRDETKMTIWARAAAAFLLLAGAAQAESCRTLVHDGDTYAVCEAAAGEDLRLFLNDAGRCAHRHVRTAARRACGRGTAAGLCDECRDVSPRPAPVGLYRAEGREISRLVTSAGPGNFGLLPNGVFCIRADGFAVIETLAFERDAPTAGTRRSPDRCW